MSTTTITTLRDTTPTPDGLLWENPPTLNQRPGKYSGLAAALRENPSKWAMVRQCPTHKTAAGFAQNIRSGKFVDFRDGNYEAVVRTVDGSARVYVRYLPTTNSDTTPRIASA